MNPNIYPFGGNTKCVTPAPHPDIFYVYHLTSKKMEVGNARRFKVKFRDSLFKTATKAGSKTFNPFGRSVTLAARKKK